MIKISNKKLIKEKNVDFRYLIMFILKIKMKFICSLIIFVFEFFWFS